MAGRATKKQGAQKPAKKAPARSRRARSSEPIRARGAKKKPAAEKPAAAQAKCKKAKSTPPPASPPRGRPKNSPDVWTAEHIEAVAEDLWNYIESTPCPTEAEFCYTRGIHFQRLSDIPLLRELKEFIFAKRQAYTIGRGVRLAQGDGPLGAFLQKLAANAGPYSLTDKTDIALYDDKRLPRDERLARINELMAKAGKA